MLNPVDGPAKQYVLSITDAAVTEVVKPAESALEERKVVTIQAQTGAGKIRVYWGDGVSTPNAATVSSDGITQFKNQIMSYEASQQQPLFIISETGNVDVVVVERA